MRSTSRTRRGFTIPELMISLTILGLFAGTLVHSLRSMRGLANSSSAISQLQDMSEGAVRQINRDLKRSGFVTSAGAAYPQFFLDGAGPLPHTHPPATKLAQPGDPDFGPNREILFLQPLDADGDQIPDLDGNGRLLWDPTEISYVVITGLDGTNYLERRVNGVAPRIVAKNVERIEFEDSNVPPASVPIGCLRVRIFFRKQDANGAWHRLTAESMVRLRNR